MPIINGKKIADERLTALAKKIAHSDVHRPKLAILLVGKDERSLVYVRNKIRKADSIGINTLKYHFDEDVDDGIVARAIQQINKDKGIHGIILQLPVPAHLNTKHLLSLIDPNKDVDGLTPLNTGNFVAHGQGVVPCTPRGVLELIHTILPDIRGKTAIVIGRSNIVGKPMAALLQQNHATVIHTHSHTKNLKKLTQQADIVVCAVGKPGLLEASDFKPGAVIIDVGISSVNGQLFGDVTPSPELEEKCFFTPVPGGVGPMTIACLMENTYDAFVAQRGSHER